MSYGMYISAEGARAQSRSLEVVANNLANVDTVGFKRDVTSFQARFAEAIQQASATPGDESVNDVGGGVKVIEVETDHSAGRLQETGNDLDLAIVGDGFFHVKDDDGQTVLTRAGNFQLDTQGRLITQTNNQSVLDQSGGEIQLIPNVPWSMGRDGVINQAGRSIVMGLSRPLSLDTLVKTGSNQFRPSGEFEPIPPAERHVRQGFLELSSANPTRQMMAMIEATRAFEANTRMIQNQDSVTGTLINRLLLG